MTEKGQEVLFQQLIPDLLRSYLFKALNIYVFNPHVVNRKLFGAKTEYIYAINKKNVDFKPENIIKQLNDRENIDEDVIISIFDELELKYTKLPFVDLDAVEENHFDEEAGLLIVNKLLPRNLNVFKSLNILSLIDFSLNEATFMCLQPEDNNLTPKFPYTISYNEEKLQIKATKLEEKILDEKSSTWLKTTLAEKLLKWISNLQAENVKENTIKSLNLLENIEEYNSLYARLKEKYGTEMVRIWPETTDPKKYVFEDVAIATYLLTIWKLERKMKNLQNLQTFVDLGCGNGLLVHILSSEGHQGIGIDLRKRKIWEMFPESTKLKEEIIIPSCEYTFPNSDWIIGNHSDELSLWVPAIAACSSYKTNYFLLPCCAYEFDGSKYQRKNCGQSLYMDFLDRLKEFSSICGYETKIDRLKIPSTKRICLVGQSRNYPQAEFDIYRTKIRDFINLTNSNNGSLKFIPRETVEKVRNCTQIDRNVIDEIVKIVFDFLISKKRTTDEFGRAWNIGGTVAISDLVQQIPVEKLTKLKSECGGLQTLLRNSYIFQISDGNVQLKKPLKVGDPAAFKRTNKKKQKNIKLVNFKEKPCWFHQNHPDGCPLDDDDCRFKH